MKQFILSIMCLAMVGCSTMGPYTFKRGYGAHEPAVKWTEHRLVPYEEEAKVVSGFKPDYLYTEFRNGNDLYAFSRPAEFYGYLFDQALQHKLDRAIATAPAGTSRNFHYRGQRYRFVSEAEIYYSSHTNKACRQGVLYREADGKYQSWDKIPSTFCKSGPRGEWLPMT